ncbi:MAG: N-6 DNA methylase [Candidatus Bathyarchaeia archaeon]
MDVWDKDIEEVIRDIIRRLDWFDFAEFITKPEYVVDYLKNFYQEVFPKPLRHDLGEFYTPDWLAAYLVNQSGFDGDVQKRILDPACGSGTFLVAVLNKVYEKYKKELHKEKLVPYITKNIVGFDINPVAVLTARTNYLISLSRFNLQKTRITVPIYLTDSIVLPELVKQPKLTDKAKLYGIKTTKEVFYIPADIKDQIAPVMLFLKENVEREQDIEDVKEQLRQRFGFEEKIIHHLSELYCKLVELNSKDQNKIWCDIIINQFATLFQSKFDFVIGNPPWVNWEFLDDEYQKHLMRINDEYGLYFTKGLESRLGKVKRDISAIFFYVCSDVYLKEKGTIAFLIKPMYQVPMGRGFRNFNRETKDVKIEKLKTPLKVLLVEDVTKENPFEINNEVSLIIAKKGEKTEYPIVYKKWTGKRMHELEDYVAEPSDANDALSTWIIYQSKKPAALGRFSYKIRTGIYHGLKEAFFDLQILIDKGELVQIRNCEGKVKDIEKDRVYPFIVARHVKKWKIEDSSGQRYTYCILPQSYPEEKNENKLKKETPKTWEWLNDFREQLLSRKSKVFAKEPFYSIYGLGDWESKYKVVWVRMGFSPNFVVVSSVVDKFLGEKPVLPAAIEMFVPTNSKEEAHYICAVLNSSLVRESLKALSSKSKSGLSSSIVSKVRLDKFNPKNNIHKKLANLSQKAHQLAEKNDSTLKEVEKEIDTLVEKLYSS